MNGAVSAFLKRNFQHFNAATVIDAGEAYVQHLNGGGQMLLALAGAMSTAEIGISLAEMIRREKIHAICCTGANLEEDLFNLIAHRSYQRIGNYRDLTPAQEWELFEKGLNRVTDTCIPEDEAIRKVEQVILEEWVSADTSKERHFPHEFLFRLLRDGKFTSHYQIDLRDSWLHAAMERDLPIFVPGWEDSTLGNMYAAHCMEGSVKNIHTVKNGLEYLIELAKWYSATTRIGILSDWRRHCRRFRDLRGADASRGSESGRRASLGLLLPDQRFNHKLWFVFWRASKRENNLGQIGSGHAKVRYRI